MALRIGAPSSIVFPMDFRHSASASRHPAKAPWPADVLPQRLSRTASPLQHLGQHLRCSALAGQLLRRSAPASNKPHQAEKSTPVWLAIWRTWAGFANSQHRDAAFATPDNICAHSSLLQTLSSCSDRRKSVGPSAPIAYATSVSPQDEAAAWLGRKYPMGDKAVAWPDAAFLQITARTNPRSRHLWGTLARAVASI